MSDDVADWEIPGLTLEELDRVLAEPWVTRGGLHGHGEANLRAWLVAGRPPARRELLCVSGSPAAVRAVRAVVDKLPEAVASFLVDTTAISWVPPGLGLTGPWPTPPRRPEGRIDMSFSITEQALGLVAHEIGHRWVRDPELYAELTTAEIEELDELIRAAPGGAERTERADAEETIADMLASAWLGVEIDTSSTRDRGRRVVGGGPR